MKAIPFLVIVAGLLFAAEAATQTIGCKDVPHEKGALTLTLKSDDSAMNVDLEACPLENVNLTFALEPRKKGGAIAALMIKSLRMLGGFVEVVPAGGSSHFTAADVFGQVSITAINVSTTGCQDAFLVNSKGLEVQDMKLSAIRCDVSAMRNAFVVVAPSVKSVKLSANDSHLFVSEPKQSSSLGTMVAALSVVPANGTLSGTELSIHTLRSTVNVSTLSSASAIAASVGSATYSMHTLPIAHAAVSIQSLSLIAEQSNVLAAAVMKSSAALSVFGTAEHVNLDVPKVKIAVVGSLVNASIHEEMNAQQRCSGVLLAASIGSMFGRVSGSSFVSAPGASLSAISNSVVYTRVADSNGDWDPTYVSTAAASVGVASMPVVQQRDEIKPPMTRLVSITLPNASIEITSSAAMTHVVRTTGSAAAAAGGVAMVGMEMDGSGLSVAATASIVNATAWCQAMSAAAALGVAGMTPSELTMKLPDASFSSLSSSQVFIHAFDPDADEDGKVPVCSSAVGAAVASCPPAGSVAVSSVAVLDVTGATIVVHGDSEGPVTNNITAPITQNVPTVSVASFVAVSDFTPSSPSTGSMTSMLLANKTSISVSNSWLNVSAIADATAVAGLMVANLQMDFGFVNSVAPTQTAYLAADSASVVVEGNTTAMRLMSFGVSTVDTPGSSVVAGIEAVTAGPWFALTFMTEAPLVSQTVVAPNAAVSVNESSLFVDDTANSLAVVGGFGFYVDASNSTGDHNVDITNGMVSCSGDVTLYLGNEGDVSYSPEANAICGVVVTTRGRLSVSHDKVRTTNVRADQLNVSMIGSPSVLFAPMSNAAASIGSFVVWTPECMGGQVVSNITARNISISAMNSGKGQIELEPSLQQYDCNVPGIIVGGVVMMGLGMYVPGAVDVSGSLMGCPLDKQWAPYAGMYVGWFGVFSPLFMDLSVDFSQCPAAAPSSPSPSSHSGAIVGGAIAAVVVVIVAIVAVMKLRKTKNPEGDPLLAVSS